MDYRGFRCHVAFAPKVFDIERPVSLVALTPPNAHISAGEVARILDEWLVAPS